MRAFAIAVVLVSGSILFALPAVPGGNEISPFYQAFCNDGDGPLTDWIASRYDAYVIGRDHELSHKGHRWEILVQQGQAVIRVPVCARLTEGSTPETLKLENTCGKCVVFTVSRTSADGNSVKAKEFKIEPKKTRHFRKLSNTTIKVEGERDCGE